MENIYKNHRHDHIQNYKRSHNEVRALFANYCIAWKIRRMKEIMK
jgi:hypothetical protein